MDFAGREGIELPDEMLDSVSGGFQIQWQKVELTYDVPAAQKKKEEYLFVPPPPIDIC